MSAVMEEEIKRWTARRKSALVLGNAELDRLRRQFADPDVEQVCALLQAHGCGLEQELLLHGGQERTGPPPG